MMVEFVLVAFSSSVFTNYLMARSLGFSADGVLGLLSSTRRESIKNERRVVEAT